MYEHEEQWRHEARRMLKQHLEPKSIMFPEQVDELMYDMAEYLDYRQLSYEIAAQNRWYPTWYNGPRIIVPCVRSGTIGQWWQGRLLENLPNTDIYKRWDSPHGPRGDALCHFNAGSNEYIICEGPMDALAAAGAGYSAIAILGANPPPNVLVHASILIGHKPVICVTDRDALKYWIKIQNALGFMGVHSKIVEPPSEYKDLAKMPEEDRELFIREALWKRT